MCRCVGVRPRCLQSFFCFLHLLHLHIFFNVSILPRFYVNVCHLDVMPGSSSRASSQTAASAKRDRGGKAKHGCVFEKRRAVASTQTEELEIHLCPETLLAEIRHFAAVDLGRCGSDEKTWTTVPRTATTQKEDATTNSRDVVL